MPSSAKLLMRLLVLVALGLAVRQWTNRPQAPAAPPVSPAMQVVQQALKDNRVMVFSKSYCGYSARAKTILSILPKKFGVMELDQRPDGPDIQRELGQLTGATTVPRVFIDGKFIGGADDLQALDLSGQLQEMLTAKGLMAEA